MPLSHSNQPLQDLDPQISRMSSELIQTANFGASSSQLILVSGAKPDRDFGYDVYSNIAKHFIIEKAPDYTWNTFKECFKFCVAQNIEVDCFARQFLDLVQKTKFETFYKDLPEILDYAVRANLNIHDFLAKFKTQIPENLDRNSFTETDLAYVYLADRVHQYSYFSINSLNFMLLRTTPQLKAVEKLFKDAVLLPIGKDKGKVTFAIAKVYLEYHELDKTPKDFWKPELVKELLNELDLRLKSKQPLGTLCNRLDQFLTYEKIDLIIQPVIFDLLLHYRSKGADISAVFNAGNFNIKSHEALSDLTKRIIKLDILLPYSTEHTLEELNQYSDQDLVFISETEKLALQFAEKDKDHVITFRLSQLAILIVGLDAERSLIQPMGADFEILGDNVTLDVCHDIISKYTNLVFQSIISPLKSCYSSDDFINAEGSLCAAAQEFSTSGLDDLHSTTRSTFGLKALHNAINHYVQNGWEFGLAAFQLLLYSQEASDRNSDRDRALNAIVNICIKNNLKLDGLCLGLVALQTKLFTFYEPEAERSTEVIENILIKLKPAFEYIHELSLSYPLESQAQQRLLDQVVPWIQFGFVGCSNEHLLKLAENATRYNEPISVESECDYAAHQFKLIILNRIGEVVADENLMNWLESNSIFSSSKYRFSLNLHNCSERLHISLIWNKEIINELFQCLDVCDKNINTIINLLTYFNSLQGQDFTVGQIRFLDSQGIGVEFQTNDLLKNAYSLPQENLVFFKSAADAIKSVYESCGPDEFYLIKNNVFQTLINLSLMESQDFLFTIFINSLRANLAKQGRLQHIKASARDILAHKAMQLLSYGERWQSLPQNHQKKYLKAISVMSNFIQDSPPFLMSKDDTGSYSPEVIKIIKETREVGTFGRDLAYSPKTLRYPCTRFGEKAEITDFGLAMGAEVYAVNGMQFKSPGPGYVLKNLDPLKCFLPDKDSSKDRRPKFTEIEKAWAYGKAIYDLDQGTEFWFMQYFPVIIVPPDDQRFYIAGTHMTMVSANILTENYNFKELMLIPTKVWRTLTAGSLIEINEYDGPIDNSTNLSNRGVTIEKIRQLCHDMSFGLIELTSGSTFNGTLANAGEAFLPPFHLWENNRRDETKDAWGHVHKSHVHGGFRSRLDTDLENFFIESRAQHSAYYEIANNFKNLLYMALKMRSFWIRGLSTDFYTDTQETSSEQLNLDEFDFEAPEDKDMPYIYNPHANRALCYAYKIYNYYLLNSDKTRHNPPVYCIAPTRSLSSSAISPAINTADMTLFDGESWLQLPLDGDGNGEIEQELFRKVLRRMNMDQTIVALAPELVEDFS